MTLDDITLRKATPSEEICYSFFKAAGRFGLCALYDRFMMSALIAADLEKLESYVAR